MIAKDYEEEEGAKGFQYGTTSISSGNTDSQNASLISLNKKVVMKIDLVILPFLICTIFLQLLDKNCLSYAQLYGLSTDTGLVGQEYSWLATIFYMGYLFSEIPLFFVIPKFKRLCKFISVLLIIWGGLLMCMAACSNFAGLATVRFLLGVFEAAIQPCCLMISTSWYTRKEQPLRMALWSNTFAGIFNGIFGYAIGHWGGSLSTWKYLFLVYGSVTVLYGTFCLLVIPDSIESAWFLNKEEKNHAIARIATNQTGIHLFENKNSIKWKQVIESLTDPKYWLLIIFIIVQNFINSGVTNFNTLIIKGFGYSNYRTMLLATPQAAIAMFASLLAATVIYFTKNLRCLIICLTTSITMVGIIMLWKVDSNQHRNTSLGAIYLLGFYNAPYVLALSLIASNNSGSTKKAFNSMSVGLFYALGNLIGPQFFLTSESPKYETGIKAMLSSCVIMYACVILYAILCYIENKKNENEKSLDAQTTDVIGIGQEVDRLDLTDKENKHFRYTF
ncbi:hypothetical protein CANARDRAFT_200033 [[Candida] arabinofermentans NRRL YB-2248]|uniref:Major facilitator superfamily (MFS) profile domain-containing protein n=1 Tax=[Candida] arabinofermentans NRRL YB-2248 TaxID=983967 RepID=A0A1E4SZC4_9ASCO|nr:hypothetical protein CANARDRAFT_200033 [[Candida] arabinofermentans NRRL YB-2248]